MRNCYHFTITSHRGSRHFSLNQRTLRFLAGAGLTVGMLLLVAPPLVSGLSSKVNGLESQTRSLKQQKIAIGQENRRLLAEQQHLMDAIETKEQALGELDHIETLIGLQPQSDLPLQRRVDIAVQTASEKHLMLESVPSGSPVGSEQITSGFGMRNHPVLKRRAMHDGVDLQAQRGTPVYATADGVVERASGHEVSGMGNMVRIVHNYGFTTIYAHLDKIESEVGNHVNRGDLVGYSGSTGLTSAPHLHYEVHYLQRQLDPQPFLVWSLEDYEDLFNQEEHVQWDSLVAMVRKTANTRERRSLPQGHGWSATLP